MSSLMRKRAMKRENYSNKRQRRAPLYRAVKPEMKFRDLGFSYTALTNTNLLLTDVPTGTGFDDRVGNRIKVHYIEYFLRSQSTVRCDILCGNDATAVPVHTIDGPVNRNSFNVIKSEVYNPNSTGNWMQYDSAKLPFGMIVKYSASTGATGNSNNIRVRLQTPTSTDINGYFRIYFTDV